MLQTTPEPSSEVDAYNRNVERLLLLVDTTFDSRFSSFELKLNMIGLEVVGAAIGDGVDSPEIKLRK